MTNSKSQLDDHVRSMIEWHFSEETGTPYWIRWAREHGLDPLKDVGSFDDLSCFGIFDIENLRLGTHEGQAQGLSG